MKRAYVDTPTGQIHYAFEGKGEWVLLLHQSPLSLKEFSEVIPILGKSYRVVAMDTPGYGGSDPVPREYSMEDYTRCVIDFMDALRIKKASIVGEHTGASIAVEIAASNPKRVDKLILIGCPVYTPEERQGRLASMPERLERAKIKEDGSHLMNLWQGQRKTSPSLKPESWQRSVTDALVVGPYDAHWAVYRHDVVPRLPLIKSPTLLVSGTEDVFYHQLEATKKLIPRCQTKIIQGGGIVLPYEKAKELSEAILDFLRSPGV